MILTICIFHGNGSSKHFRLDEMIDKFCSYYLVIPCVPSPVSGINLVNRSAFFEPGFDRAGPTVLEANRTVPRRIVQNC